MALNPVGGQASRYRLQKRQLLRLQKALAKVHGNPNFDQGDNPLLLALLNKEGRDLLHPLQWTPEQQARAEAEVAGPVPLGQGQAAGLARASAGAQSVAATSVLGPGEAELGQSQRLDPDLLFGRKPWYMLDPQGVPRAVWDVAMSIMIIGCCIFLTMMAAFSAPTDTCFFLPISYSSYDDLRIEDLGQADGAAYLGPIVREFMLYICFSVQVLFTLDIGVHCITGYVRDDERGVWVDYRLRSTCWAYARSLWWIIHVASVFPLDCVLQSSLSGSITMNFTHLNMLLQGATLYYRLRGDMLYWIQLGARAMGRLALIPFFVRRITGMLVGLLLVLHVLSCVLWFTLRAEHFPEGTWPHLLDLLNTNTQIGEQYLWSLMAVTSAMIGLGYGPYPPITEPEAAVWVVIMLVAAVSFAIFNSTVTVGMFNNALGHMRYEETMDALMRVMKERELPKALQLRLLQFFERKYRDHRITDETPVLSQLPRSLAADVAMYSCGPLLHRLPLLSAVHASQVQAAVAAVAACGSAGAQDFISLPRGVVERLAQKQPGATMTARLEAEAGGHRFGVASMAGYEAPLSAGGGDGGKNGAALSAAAEAAAAAVVSELSERVALMLVPEFVMAGEEVVREGLPATHLYFVEQGFLERSMCDVRLDTLRAGDTFDEQALLEVLTPDQVAAELAAKAQRCNSAPPDADAADSAPAPEVLFAKHISSPLPPTDKAAASAATRSVGAGATPFAAPSAGEAAPSSGDDAEGGSPGRQGDDAKAAADAAADAAAVEQERQAAGAAEAAARWSAVIKGRYASLATVTAITDCNLYTLEGNAFRKLLHDFPHTEELFQQRSATFFRLLMAVFKEPTRVPRAQPAHLYARRMLHHGVSSIKMRPTGPPLGAAAAPVGGLHGFSMQARAVVPTAAAEALAAPVAAASGRMEAAPLHASHRADGHAGPPPHHLPQHKSAAAGASGNGRSHRRDTAAGAEGLLEDTASFGGSRPAGAGLGHAGAAHAHAHDHRAPDDNHGHGHDHGANTPVVAIAADATVSQGGAQLAAGQAAAATAVAGSHFQEGAAGHGGGAAFNASLP